MSAQNPTERAEDNGQMSLRDLVIRIDERVKTLTDGLKTQQVKCPIDMGKFDTRISKLENWKWFIMGACAIISVMVDIIIRK